MSHAYPPDPNTPDPRTAWTPTPPQDPWPNAPRPPMSAPPGPPYPPAAPGWTQPPGYPPPVAMPHGKPPKVKKAKGQLIVAAVGVAVLLCCGGVLLVNALSGNTGGNQAGSSATDSPAAAASQAPPAGAAVVAWMGNGGQQRITAIGGDFNALHAAGQNTPAARRACASLQRDVESAQAYPPIPDLVAQPHWTAALADYARAATDCLAGVDTFNADLLARAATEMSAGNDEVDAVTARVKALAG